MCKGQMLYGVVKRLEKKAGMVLFTILLVFLLLALFPMNVSGSNAGMTAEESYHDFELCFLEVLDMRLREYGYSDAGLTLNSIIYADGSRCYYVGIHHVRITAVGAEAWEDLKLQLSDISFPVDNCTIIYEIVP